MVNIPDVPGDGHGGDRPHNQAKPQLIAFQGLLCLTREDQKVYREIHRKQQHEDGDDDLHRRVAERAYGRVHIGKTAGSGCGHGMGDGVVPVQPRHAQAQRLQHGERQIDGV